MSLEDLDHLIAQWESVCGSATISIGDGVIADFVDDLEELSNEELSHLVIRTENPIVTISLRRNRAEIAYMDDANAGVLLSTIKYSLRPYKIKTPYFRLRVFWAWIYMLGLMVIGLVDFILHSNPAKLPHPPAFMPPMNLLPSGPPPPPPAPPLFSTPLFIIALITLILLTAWFIYSYSKLDAQSSTRLTRKRAKALEGVVIISDEPIENE
jgi:hypothetical protein